MGPRQPLLGRGRLDRAGPAAVLAARLALGLLLLAGAVACQRSVEQDPLSVDSLTAAELDRLTDLAFAALEARLGGTEAPPLGDPLVVDGVETFVLVRVDGRRRGVAGGPAPTLQEGIVAAVAAIVDREACEANLACYGVPTLEELEGATVELFVLGAERALDPSVLGISRAAMHGLPYEPGIDTLRLHTPDGVQTFLADVQVVGNFQPRVMVERLCERAGRDASCLADEGVHASAIETLHVISRAPGAGAERLFRSNVVTDVPPSLADVEVALEGLNDWLTSNLDDDGMFRYLYSLGSGTYSSRNNDIRQLMASRALAELAAERPDDADLLGLHRQNLAWMFATIYREAGDEAYIFMDGKSKLGGIAMGLRTLLASPDRDLYEDEARKLTNAILSLRKDDGSFAAWYVEPDYAFDEDYLLTFYSGEALLALAEYVIATGDQDVLAATIATQDHYLIAYVDEMAANYYPAYVPWHTMSLHTLHGITGDVRYPEAAFALNDALLEIQPLERPRFVDTWGRFFEPTQAQYGLPHSSSTAVYLEGVTYAYELARDLGDAQRAARYLKSIRLASMNLINLQFDETNTYYLSRPDRVMGAVRIDGVQNEIRVDTTQHASDAFTRIVKVFDAEEFHGGGADETTTR